MCLYAKNLKGWHSLLRLSTESYETGYYAKYASVDLDVLKEHSDGVMCSTACIKSYMAQLLLQGKQDEAEQHFLSLREIYKDDLLCEIQPHDVDEQRTLNNFALNMSIKHGQPLLPTCDKHFTTPDKFKTYQVAAYMSMNTSYEAVKKKKEEGKRVLEFDLDSLYQMDDEEITEAFKNNHPDIPYDYIKEAINNSTELVDRVSFWYIDRRQKMPDVKKIFPNPEKQIREWVNEGLKRIGKENDKEYLERLEYEWSELARKDVFDYFCIVGEAVRWAKENKVRVGLGRGSAAGCLVSYLVGITNIDPISYNLLFERFLNPNRKGMPDIDIDFDDKGRQSVKDHLGEIWGKDHVADIIAHQTLKPKAVLRGVSRVHDISFPEVSAVTETIDIKPDDEETTLEQLRPINPILDEYAKKYPDIWEHATALELSPANASKHAAGLVVTDQAIREYLPLERSKNGGMVTAFNDSAAFPIIEWLGLMKIDFLGVKGLSKQAYAAEIVEQEEGIVIDFDTLPILSDPRAVEKNVMQLFTNGQTLGVWQFSGGGITDLLRHIKPDSILDLVAANALYRPGPMDKAFEYGDRKKMPAEELDYWHPSIKQYLEETYGIVAYQEQLMQIVQEIGGFSPGDADDMRKAMGKLYRLPGKQAQEFMQGYYSQWEEGCKKNKIEKKSADEMWKFFLNFGNYAFNKSHSASYAVQAYIDAWLKANYPIAFYAALLTTVKKAKPEEDAQFRAGVFREARMFDAKVSPPDINLSELGFTVKDGAIRFGLLAIKDVGDAAITEILNARPFKSIEDFDERMREPGNIKIKSNVRQALIDAGAFDSLGMRDHFTTSEKSILEKQKLGVSVTSADLINKNRKKLSEIVHTRSEFDAIPTRKSVTKEDESKCYVQLVGEVTNVKPVKTKNKEQMAIVNIADGIDEYKITVFPWAYKKFKEVLSADSILVAGYKDEWNGSVNVNATKMMNLEEYIKDA